MRRDIIIAIAAVVAVVIAFFVGLYVGEERPAITAADEFKLRRECAEAAGRYSKSQDPGLPLMSVDFEDHYNLATHECFAVLTFENIQDNSISTRMTVADAVDRREVASCAWETAGRSLKFYRCYRVGEGKPVTFKNLPEWYAYIRALETT